MLLFIMLYKVVLTFEHVDENPSVTIQIKAMKQYLNKHCVKQFRIVHNLSII